DLIGELAEACDEYGLGLCLYYSHGRDWRHPHAPNNDEYPRSARPEYDPPEPTYAYGDEHDLSLYVEFMWNQITELLENYAPVAAIWLDGIITPQSGDLEPFEIQKLYDHIHAMQPQVLVSYKQGMLGTEDFFAPEHSPAEDHRGELMEICTTMCPKSWGYYEDRAGTHMDADEVWEQLEYAGSNNCNLLLNTGPLPDGSIDPEDEPVLREVGSQLRSEGFPE
ncbi:MAG: alpha-L-fucosidase, partial [Armatimonadota bacterium]